MSSWFKKTVTYHIFIDRFAGYNKSEKWDQPVFIGGNINGIIDKFDYIKDLGVNAIWLSPFYKTSAYHGYHITDFYSVEPNFGSESDIIDLIKIAHQNNIRLIADFVPNHCSSQHPYFVDAVNNPDSKYIDWFTFSDWPKEYKCFLSYRELPKLNLDNPDVMDHIIGSARKWLSLGFDGLRVDHIIGLSNKNVYDIFLTLKNEFPDSVFIGEALATGIASKDIKTLNIPKKYLIWALKRIGFTNTSSDIMYKNYVGLMDGILDFGTADILLAYAKSKSAIIDNKLKIKQLKHRQAFDNKLLLPSFLDNHDMERFLFRCGGDVNKLEKAIKYQFSLDQPVIIYYGTEVGLTQNESFKSRASYADLLARKPMIWDKDNQNQKLLKTYKELCKLKLD